MCFWQHFKEIIPAKDPKQCAVRILKGKVERTQIHQRLQASRTRATLVMKTLCSIKVVSGRKDARSDSASSLCEDLCKGSCAGSPWHVQDPWVRPSVQGACGRSPQKIFVRDLKVRSLYISVQLIYNSQRFRQHAKHNYLFCYSFFEPLFGRYHMNWFVLSHPCTTMPCKSSLYRS